MELKKLQAHEAMMLGACVYGFKNLIKIDHFENFPLGVCEVVVCAVYPKVNGVNPHKEITITVWDFETVTVSHKDGTSAMVNVHKMSQALKQLGASYNERR